MDVNHIIKEKKPKKNPTNWQSIILSNTVMFLSLYWMNEC